MQYKVLKKSKKSLRLGSGAPERLLCRGRVQCAVFPEEIIAILADWIRGLQPVH